jgi:hypothetical protein|tara:strand:+ start:67 stop:255 length:189 start_codon:yes stop_codon:yes gene_type:complete
MKKKSLTKRGKNNPKKKVKRMSDDTATFKGQMEPSKTRFGVKHILQAIVGATLLAVPIENFA